MRGKEHQRNAATAAVAVITAICVGLLASGCTETDSLLGARFEPLQDGDGQSGWTRIFPPVSAAELNALWGQDADDLWIVGENGTILHFDGTALRPVTSPTRAHLRAIDGYARDAVWAVTSRMVLRWDGRRWQTVLDAGSSTELTTVCALGPTDVFVGGRSSRHGILEPAIWRFDGRSWGRMVFENETEAIRVQRIWRPSPATPPLAATRAGVYRLGDDSWQLLPGAPAEIRSTAEDLVLVPHSDDIWLVRAALERVNTDGSFEQLCSKYEIDSARHLVIGPTTLLVYENQIRELLDGCRKRWLIDLPGSLRAVAMPIEPGRQGRHFYALASDGGVARITWRPDHSLTYTDLLPVAENRKVSALVGAGANLHALEVFNRVLRQVGDPWQAVDLPFTARRVRALASGTIAVLEAARFPRIAIMSPDGQTLLSPPIEIDSGYASVDFLIDDALQPTIVVGSHVNDSVTIWQWQGAAWLPLLDVREALQADGVVFWKAAGSAPDDLYLLLSVEQDAIWSQQIVHFDGNRLAPAAVFDSSCWVSTSVFVAAPLSRRVFLRFATAGGDVHTAYLADRELTVLPPQSVDWDQLTELDDGRIFCATSSDIYALNQDGEAPPWTPVPSGSLWELQDIWGHSERGLFAVANDGEIHHYPLARTTR